MRIAEKEGDLPIFDINILIIFFFFFWGGEGGQLLNYHLAQG